MIIYAVGIGPGNTGYIAPEARNVIVDCDVIVGYSAYVKLIESITEGKEIISTGMKGETERCERAFKEAKKGRSVAVVSSGDAGVYGMASLLYEMSEKYDGIQIKVIPGITAATAAASILGAPLSNDFAVISLSDLLTPWELIEKRLVSAAQGDFAICLYNPQSHSRSGYLERACDILLKHIPAKTYCGYVGNALRGDDSRHEICTLEELKNKPVDMFTTVIIGNSQTKIIMGKLVTSRGYNL